MVRVNYKREHILGRCCWRCLLLNENAFVSFLFSLVITTTCMQKLQITKITAPAAFDLSSLSLSLAHSFMQQLNNLRFLFHYAVAACYMYVAYMNQIATLIIFWLHFITGENYSDFFFHFFFVVALMHKKRTLPPPWLRK